ncbi:MAG: papain-like cysteine protease family protein [Mariniblastus sp.]
MSIELKVVPRRQATANSCWWASIAMVLQYYGRNYRVPSDFSNEFSRTHDPNSRGFSPPNQWYQNGLPIQQGAYRLLSEITGFRGLRTRPRAGAWTAIDVSRRLRRYGPLVFFGQWNGAPHSIVVTGLSEIGPEPRVVMIDPARGFPSMHTLEDFNSHMGRLNSISGLNPFYFPVRSGAQVQEVVMNDAVDYVTDIAGLMDV